MFKKLFLNCFSKIILFGYCTQVWKAFLLTIIKSVFESFLFYAKEKLFVSITTIIFIISFISLKTSGKLFNYVMQSLLK